MDIPAIEATWRYSVKAPGVIPSFAEDLEAYANHKNGAKEELADCEVGVCDDSRPLSFTSVLF